MQLSRQVKIFKKIQPKQSQKQIHEHYPRSNESSVNNISQKQLNHLYKSAQSPINYNSCIDDERSRKKCRYRMKNYRRPQLRITFSKNLPHQTRSTSYNANKSLQNQQKRNLTAYKKEHETYFEEEKKFTEKLRSDMIYSPNISKIPHRNCYRPNKRNQIFSTDHIAINGNKIQDYEKQIWKNHKQKFLQLSEKSTYHMPGRKNYLAKQGRAKKQKLERLDKNDQPLTGWVEQY